MRKHLRFQAYGEAGAPPVAALLPVVRPADSAELPDIVRESDGGTLVLADCRSGMDLQRMHVQLSVVEARLGMVEGTIRIIASAADSAVAVLGLPGYAGKSPRLAGLTWCRADLAADLGCDPQSATLEHARWQVVIAARAAGVPAYDCGPDMAESGNAWEDFVLASRRLGFYGIATGR